MGLKAVATPGANSIIGSLVAGGKQSLPLLSASGLQIPSRLLPRSVMASPPTVVTGTTASYSGSVTGSISTTVLTVTAVSSGSVRVGVIVTGTSVSSYTIVTAQLTGTPGGIGTYSVNNSQTVSSETLTLTPQYAWNAGGSSAGQQANERFSLSRAFFPLNQNGATNFNSGITTTLTATPTTQGASGQISFYHDGQILEIGVNASSNYLAIRVDDAYVNLTPYSCGASGNFFVLLDFGSVARRRIDLINGNPLSYTSIAIGAYDAIDKAPIRGPRVICIGDSFTAGSGASAATANNWASILADYMGWDDVIISGIGGTGWVATNGGNNLNFLQRIPYDVTGTASGNAINPDLVIFMGSVNDASQTPATVNANFLAGIQLVQAALPNTVIAAGLNLSGGVELITSNYLQIKALMKATAQANNVIWIDLIEIPTLDGTADTPFLAGTGTAGNGYVQLCTSYSGSPTGQYFPPIGATYEVDTGNSNVERFRIQAFDGTHSGAQYRGYTIDGALQNTHAAGAMCTRVAGSLYTGHGKITAQAGIGTTNLYVSSDGTHPTNAGHAAIAQSIAESLQRTLRY